MQVKMDINEYLKRIGCEDAKKVSYENLAKIRKAHSSTFTFENIDMHMGVPVKFSLEDSYDRLMNRSRGGYCVQMNFVLAWALKQLGYDVCFLTTYIFSKIFEVYKDWPVHVSIMVKLDGKKYYVDGGTSRFIPEPIEIVLDKSQKTIYGTFRFINDPDYPGFLRLQTSKNARDPKDLVFEDQIRFKIDEPKQMEDFRELNEWVQTDKHPNLFYSSYCFRQSENSVYFLVGWRFTEINFGEFEEHRVDRTIETIEEIREILRNRFDLIIDDSFRPVSIRQN